MGWTPATFSRGSGPAWLAGAYMDDNGGQNESCTGANRTAPPALACGSTPYSPSYDRGTKGGNACP